MVMLLVRTDTNWNTMKLERFYQQICVEFTPGVLHFIQRRCTEKWNNIFPIHYFAFRHEIQKIALQELQKLNEPILLGGLNILKPVYTDTTDYFIAPIDDDDWFLPEIKKIEIPDNINLVVWQHTLIRLGTLPQAYSAPPPRLSSNNYMFRRSYLARFGSRDILTALCTHGAAHRLRPPEDETLVLPRRLNICNRHVGSATVFSRLLDQGVDPKEHIRDHLLYPLTDSLYQHKEPLLAIRELHKQLISG